jgi:cell division protein FtsI/penicillin-binding protein 2
MATAYSVLANGGILVKPNIIKQIEYNEDNILKSKTIYNTRVIKKETSDIITNMLNDSINN